MSRKIETATRDSDFVAIGRKSPNLRKERFSGSHWTGETDLGRVTVTNHGRELKPWLRVKIRREFVAIGLAGVIVVFLYLSNLV